jgi:hypothetical protein
VSEQDIPPPGTGPVLDPLPVVSVDAEWLWQWQLKNNFTDEVAAERLALSVSSFKRQKSGRSRVSRQTARLALLTYLRRDDIMELAIAAYSWVKLTL